MQLLCEALGDHLCRAGEGGPGPRQGGNAAPEVLIVCEARLQRHEERNLVLDGMVGVLPRGPSPDRLPSGW